MMKYTEVPDWWYGGMGAIGLALSLFTVLYYPTELTWWAFLLGVLISLVLSIPVGMIQAITNLQIGLNVLTEMIISYMQPGRPFAMMAFKTYGYITMTQGLGFIQDLKLGHYMKIPQRTMFTSQVVATIWSSIVQVAVMNWALGNIKDICQPHQAQHFNCQGQRVFFNASIIWGLIGPMRIFSPGQIYGKLLWFFPVGAAAPFVFWALAKWFPRSPAKYLMAPVIFGGTGQIPPATNLNYLPWGIVGWFFQKFLRNRYRGWWSHYNYITSAALDSGLAVSTIIIFFSLTMTGKTLNWWGNDITTRTMDVMDTAIRKAVPSGQHFGPDRW